MTKRAKPTNYLVPYTVGSMEGERFLNFKMDQDENGYYSYATVKRDFPKVVEYDGGLFRQTGWDSDNGIVVFKETTEAQVAKPVKG